MVLTSRSGRRLLAVAASAALAASLAACGGDDPATSEEETAGETGEGGTSEGSGGSLVFAGSGDPVILDGAYVSDGESIRPIRQMFETLVTTEAGGTDIVPLLATEWAASDDGLVWTFSLQDGVTFHDGTEFNAEAVCFNFDRWYNFTGIQQAPSVSYYYSTVFGGFATNEDPALPVSLYSSCEATDEATAVITLSKASSTFLSALSLPAFSMASPTALEEFGADEVSGTGEAPAFDGSFGYTNPVGSGPFKFESWEQGDRLTLVRNEEYWGDKALLDELIFTPISEGPARLQALQAGEIDGYDTVDPADLGTIEGDDQLQLLYRPAFNVGYLGMNSSLPPLDNPDIRKAVAYAIDKQNILTTLYPEGAQAAINFMPPDLWGWTDTVEAYEYDPEMAKQLIADSGVTDLTVEFWYPTDVSRPYMPDPEGNFTLMAENLEAVGFTVVPKSAPWNPDYLDANQVGTQQMYLLGWTGDFSDPDNFLGTFFQTEQPQWGFSEQAIFDKLDEAEAEPDEAAREALYVEANELIADFVPGVPYVHTDPAIAFRAGIEGYEPSPVNNEDFATVSIPSE